MHTHCRSCDTELTNDNTHKGHKHTCKACFNEEQRLKRNPKSNPDRRRVDGQYAKRSEHPDLYKTHPPGSYTLNEKGYYISLNNSSDSDVEKSTEGFIYIAVNPAWPDMLKIGMTDDRDSRKSSLNTSVPYRDTTYAHTVEVKDMRKAERLAHKLAEEVCSLRLGEWFRMPVEKAIKILDSLENDHVKLIQGDFWPDTIVA